MKKIFTFFAMAALSMGLVSCGASHELTIANLKAAIDGETAANAKYVAFSERAEAEGLPEIAALFRATAQGEAIHISNHQAALQGLGVADYTAVAPEFTVDSTLMNLEAAVVAEQDESATMYPKFIEAAQQEKADAALLSFNYAKDSEMDHARLFKEAIAYITTPRSQATVYYVCPKCGYIYAGAAAEACALCGTTQDQYIVINAVLPVATEETEVAEGTEAPVAAVADAKTATEVKK
ncbi:MAG: rubrerythrin family protein [Alistipes sp.]